MNDDLISRKRLLIQLKQHKDLFCRNRVEFLGLSKNDKARADEIDSCIATVINAPSVQPERKKGRWIPWRYHNGFMCENCNESVDNKHNYCPNCGADMRG